MSRKAILITGGAVRVGAALARYFAKRGYDIALHYHRSQMPAQKLQKSLKQRGIVCELFAQNLTDVSALPELMRQVHKKMPHCVALINNASVYERAGFMETDEALFDRQMDINYKAPFFMAQAFAHVFRKGAVINILDSDITQTQGSHFAYLLSKKTLGEFTVMAARELGPKIRVNAVCPGPISLTQSDADYIAKTKSVWPLKSQADTVEIAEAVYWLLEQKHITGQLVFVDGGKHVL